MSSYDDWKTRAPEGWDELPDESCQHCGAEASEPCESECDCPWCESKRERQAQRRSEVA